MRERERSVIAYFWGQIIVFSLVNWGLACPTEDKSHVSNWGGKKLIFRSEVRVWLSLQEINVSLCNVPRCDHSLVCICVYGVTLRAKDGELLHREAKENCEFSA